MNVLLSAIEEGISKFRHELPPSLREYHQFREDLYTVGGVIVYKNRVVIPAYICAEVLSSVHAAHQGVTSMTARTEESVFWLGVNQNTATRVTCAQCNCMAPYRSIAPQHQPFCLPAHFSVYV